MTQANLTVPKMLSRRIEKLAVDAGRTPREMLKFVLRDGLEYTEASVRDVRQSIAELDARQGISRATVTQEARKVIGQRGGGKKAA